MESEDVKRGLKWLLLMAGLALLWEIISLITNNSMICPSLSEIAEAMLEQLFSPVFFSSVFITLARAAAGLFLSFVIAALLAGLSCRFSGAGWIFDQISTLLQSIPNVAYIILLLFWAGRQEAVILVQFFLLCPMIFRELYEQLAQVNRDWREVFILYPQPLGELLKKAALPLLAPAIRASLKTGGSLALKSVVMAEILSSVPQGIGRQLQSARMNLNFAGVLAWVIWLMLAGLLFSHLWSCLFSSASERKKDRLAARQNNHSEFFSGKENKWKP